MATKTVHAVPAALENTETPPNERVITQLPAIPLDLMTLYIVGTGPLLMHQFSEKSKTEMREKAGGVARAARQPKKPRELFEAAKYKDSKGRDCALARHFKGAIVGAARFHNDFKMTELKGALYVEGDLLPLKFSRCVMREDTVRLKGGTADLRYRPEYHDWSVQLTIEFNRSVITADQLLNIIRLAGRHQGIGDWRQEKGGIHGRFDIDISKGAVIRNVDDSPKRKVA